MSENKKFVIVAVIILLIFTGEKVYRRLKRPARRAGKSYVVKMEKHTYKQADELLDINSAPLEEMLRSKVSMGHGEKIIEYREITGGFENLRELTRISGIGNKTYEKLRDKFVITTKADKEMLDINRATPKELLYYGFTKKEIKKIKIYQSGSGKIFDNITLLEILGEKRYDEFKEYIVYN